MAAPVLRRPPERPAFVVLNPLPCRWGILGTPCSGAQDSMPEVPPSGDIILHFLMAFVVLKLRPLSGSALLLPSDSIGGMRPGPWRT